jgi:mono/diheme cytochrome c family protein
MSRRHASLTIAVALAMGLGAAACGSSGKNAGTVRTDITIGTGTVATNPAGGGSSSSGGATTSGGGGSTTSGGGGSTAFGDAAAGKPLFSSKCGACHTLKDAGTSGQVGPDLDQSAKAKDPQAVYDQITKNAVPPMPLNLVTGDDAKNVAAYVASVSGK